MNFVATTRACFILLGLLAPLFSQGSEEQSSAGFEGNWQTSYGAMKLQVSDTTVSGFYSFNGVHSTIEGTIKGRTLTFVYKESNASGEGEFTLSNDGQSFTGRWREKGQTQWGQWTGKRLTEFSSDYSGLWTTSFGPMRLIQSGPKVTGSYSLNGLHCTIEGEVRDNKLRFRYQESEAEGTGWFQLDPSASSFLGEWKLDGSGDGKPWSGIRTPSTPGIIWLVVLEAQWEESLTEREYAFGEMLKHFFDRVPHVQVRHRFFANEAAFKRWCYEIAYIPDPVVISIASHGSSKGLSVGNQVISPQTIGEALAPSAQNTLLLHFSSCSIMADDAAKRIHDALPNKPKPPISGYVSTVGWAESAVIEFAYFDLILSKGLAPDVAADQLLKLMPLAGDKPISGINAEPAKFRFVTAK